MKYTRLFFATLLSVGLLSCESVVEDLNVDPNNFTEISTDLLISQGVMNLASIAESEAARILGVSRGTLRTKLKRYFDDTYVSTRY